MPCLQTNWPLSGRRILDAKGQRVQQRSTTVPSYRYAILKSHSSAKFPLRKMEAWIIQTAPNAGVLLERQRFPPVFASSLEARTFPWIAFPTRGQRQSDGDERSSEDPQPLTAALTVPVAVRESVVGLKSIFSMCLLVKSCVFPSVLVKSLAVKEVCLMVRQIKTPHH